MSKQNNYDFILKMFVSTSNIKMELTKPSLEGERYYATNGFFAVSVKKELVGIDYGPVDNYPDVAKLFNKQQELIDVEEKSFKVSELLGMMAAHDIRMEMSGLNLECKYCDGSGEQECPTCGHWDDCEQCNGQGGDKTNRGRVSVSVSVDQGFNELKFDRVTVNAQYFGTSIVALALTGAKEVGIKVHEDKLHMKSPDGTEILLMAMNK